LTCGFLSDRRACESQQNKTKEEEFTKGKVPGKP
jgi:hypothetical protein